MVVAQVEESSAMIAKDPGSDPSPTEAYLFSFFPKNMTEILT